MGKLTAANACDAAGILLRRKRWLVPSASGMATTHAGNSILYHRENASNSRSLLSQENDSWMRKYCIKPKIEKSEVSLDDEYKINNDYYRFRKNGVGGMIDGI